MEDKDAEEFKKCTTLLGWFTFPIDEVLCLSKRLSEI